MHDPGIASAPPDSVSDLLERLEETADTLPKRLRQCADVTRRHMHLIAVSTVTEMASACGVAPSVYIRFCQACGFSGYTEMQALFRARFTEFRPDYETRLATLRDTGAIAADRLLGDFAEAGHKSLISLGDTVTSGALDRIAHGMAGARVVHLVGLRRAFAVVSSMAYLLDQLNVPATLHYGAGMLNFGTSVFPGEVLFAATFAPFSEETVTLSRDAARQGAIVYCLTDSERCPISEWATETLVAREDEVAGFRALNASITLTTALAVAVKGLRDQS